MPEKALRPCARCGQLGCTTHLAKAWRSVDKAPPARIRGRQLQKLRAQLFAAHPFCEKGCGRVAVIRDHVIPLEEGGADNTVNTQALCQQCSDEKTQRESHRGRQASGGSQDVRN